MRNERGKYKMTTISKTKLIGFTAMLFAGVAANASGNQAAMQAAQDASRANITKNLDAVANDAKAMPKMLAKPDALKVKAPKAEKQTPAAGADGIRFVLTGVSLEGNSAISTDRLANIWSNKINKEIALSEVYALAEQVETAYRKKGYEFVRVLVPQQRVSGGAIRLTVVETVVGDVRFNGEMRGRSDVFEYVAEYLKGQKPLSMASLERAALLLNDLAGVEASATLSASKVAGATDVEFAIKAKPFDIAVSVDNSRTLKLGTYQLMGQASINNVIGLFEKLSINAASDLQFQNKLHLVSGALTLPVLASGLTLGGNVLYSSTDNSVVQGTTNIPGTGNNLNWGVNLAQPILRSRAQNFKLAASFDATDSKVTTGSNPVVETSLASISINPTFDIADSTGGVTMFDLTGAKGLNVLTAAPQLLTATAALGSSLNQGKAGDSQAARLFGSITRLQTVSTLPGFTVQATVTGQWAFAPLYGAQEFAFGGRGFGRGYDASTFSTDNGFAGKLELGFNVPQEALKTLKPYVFAEYGALWQRDDKVAVAGAAGVPASFQTQTSAQTLNAASWGLGLKLDVLEYASMYVEGTQTFGLSDAAKSQLTSALGTPPATTGAAYDEVNSNFRFFFGLTVKY